MSRLAWIVILCILLARNLLAVDNLVFSADAIVTDQLRIQGVMITADWQDAEHLSITLTAASIGSDYFSSLTAIRIACPATGFHNGQFQCDDGVLTYTGPDGAVVTSGFGFEYTLDHAWRVRLPGLDLNLAGLSESARLLHPSFRDYRVSAGRWHGEIELGGRAAAVQTMALSGTLSGFTFAGSSSLEAVTADLDLDLVSSGMAWSADAAISIMSGAMYIVPGVQAFGDQPGFYIEAGDSPLTLKLSATWDADQHLLAITQLEYSHPGMLSLTGSAAVKVGETLEVSAVMLRVTFTDLATAFPVYLQPLLLNTNFNNLETAGGLSLALDFRERRLNYLDVKFNGLYLDDANDRFSLSGLNGNLAMRGDAEPVQSSLTWDGMSFYRLDFGPGGVTFESAAGQVDVRHWEDLAVLDGQIEISRFTMRDIGTPDFELALDARLTPVSMQAFTQAMQWPLMSGTLSGEFQGLTYSHNNLRLNGSISIRVFDGDVTLNNLQVAGVFSEYSTLSSDLEFRDLNLEPLTDTFAFGKIAGTLNGHISDLILNNWRPAYFEAQFMTPGEDERPHRISQKALENLNSLGGGLSGTMSRGFIRFFPVYSYGQIGLSCRLNNGICELGGVKETADGFYLLTKGGLLPPWVEVKGTGRSIPWDDLIGGLKRIAQGELRIE